MFTKGATAEHEAGAASRTAASALSSANKDITTADGTQLVTGATNIPVECVSTTGLLGMGADTADGGEPSLVTTSLLKATRGGFVAVLSEEDLGKEVFACCGIRTPEEDFRMPADGRDSCPDRTSDEDFLMPLEGGFTTLPRVL